jgi:hypothetical protein
LKHSGDEEEEPTINVTAPTSTSHNLVLSETRPATEETSPPQRDLGNLTPVGSARAPSPKRARVELGKEPSLLTGSSATPSMDDVRTLTTLLFTVELFFFLTISSTFFLKPLMKEFIRLGTQFIGYRHHADNLKGIPLLSFPVG